jgi:hypothetical protein
MRAQPSRALLALILAAGFGAAHAAGSTDRGTATREYEVTPPTQQLAASQPANAVRPEFATPFNAAQAAIKAGDAAGALAKLKEAEALPNPTPYEHYLILRVRAPAEYAAGDLKSASADFQATLASDLLPAADRLPITKALAEIQYSGADYPQAAATMQQYFAAGGQDAQLKELLPQTLYLAKDYAGAAKGFQAQVDAIYAAGQKPPEKTLRLLASAQSQAKDEAGYAATLERLAVGYPKADYWKDLISRAEHADKFSDRVYVDVYRLKADALGATADAERLSYAALALRAGYPGEAQRVLDEGLAKKAFTGADLGQANKLRAEAAKGAAADKAQMAAGEASAKNAKDGNALASAGVLETVTGDPAAGTDLLQQAISKGGLKAPDEATLHLGLSQLRAGRDADAAKTFQSLTTPPGIAALAHVYALVAQSRIEAAKPTPIAASVTGGAASGAAK